VGVLFLDPRSCVLSSFLVQSATTLLIGAVTVRGRAIKSSRRLPVYIPGFSFPQRSSVRKSRILRFSNGFYSY